MRHFNNNESNCLATSMDRSSTLLYGGYRNGFVHMYDDRLQSQNATMNFIHPSSINAIHTLSTQHQFISLSVDGSIFFWDKRMPEKPCSSLLGHDNSIHNVGSCLDQQEHFLYVAGQDFAVRMWDLRASSCYPCDIFTAEIDVQPISSMIYTCNANSPTLLMSSLNRLYLYQS